MKRRRLRSAVRRGAKQVARLASGAVSRASPSTRVLYLDLLEATLVGEVHRDGGFVPGEGSVEHDPALRADGRDWPSFAHTMIGRARMKNLRALTERVLAEEIPGDLIETGVWRGGACIYMRGILEAWGVSDRVVWVADSFQGLPEPDAERYPVDEGDDLHGYAELRVSQDEVRANFAAYGLLDAQVRFLPGWFRDTLPSAPLERLALLRLDGDMYESTIVALESLYDRLSPGGFVVVDDYALPRCAQAIDDFRAQRGITAPLEQVDWTGHYWRKP